MMILRVRGHNQYTTHLQVSDPTYKTNEIRHFGKHQHTDFFFFKGKQVMNARAHIQTIIKQLQNT